MSFIASRAILLGTSIGSAVFCVQEFARFLLNKTPQYYDWSDDVTPIQVPIEPALVPIGSIISVKELPITCAKRPSAADLLFPPAKRRPAVFNTYYFLQNQRFVDLPVGQNMDPRSANERARLHE